ncbi:protein FMC1 homolog [Caerostris extrusa]|uniref:Protein FMC1 homolog n=1 Tax=Caerostris extrusa TaxID=172846 RepID=A0AAV4MW61_CAEEX|nr:protein FMC1 homolog [Caerostris extrusa]
MKSSVRGGESWRSELDMGKVVSERRLFLTSQGTTSMLKPVSQTTALSYLMNEYRSHQVTEKRICKNNEELNMMAKTYLCYLESLRQNQELIDRYHSHGERSVEETAQLVGFSLPQSSNDKPVDKET